MATTIRRLSLSAAWLVVALVAGLPVVGVVLGLWPTVALNWADVNAFIAYNGLSESIANSLLTALVAPLLALYVAFMVYSQYRFSPRWQTLEKRLAPLLSLPHLAVALGLVYLFSSGGMVWDALWGLFGQPAPTHFGLERKSLITMILAISLKEIPFFLLIFSAIGRQLPIKSWLLQGRALGYSETTSWWLLVFPGALQQSRLALLAAMAYTVSVLDVSLLIGPNIPQLYAVLLYEWQTSFNHLAQAQAFMGNIVLLLMLGVLVALIYLHEFLILRRLTHHAVMGSPLPVTRFNRVFVVWLGFFSLLSVAVLTTFLLWSLGGDRQGTIDYSQFSLALWQQEWFFIQLPLLNSIMIALISSVLGVAITLLALELQRQRKHYMADHYWLLAILLPQLSMVYGWQIAHSSMAGSYQAAWIILAHLPFTFAYSYLVLRGPFQSLDRHYELVAASFGYRYWQQWWQVRIVLLRPALLIAWAMAFSVSIAQYIPTLMIGAGRVATITTEAVAVASGNEQSITALYMLVQSALPFLAFFVASILAQRIRGSFDAAHH
jgi:putative thiamine transport system permease protein